MTKTIILTEQQNKILMRQMLREAKGDVIIGRDTYNEANLNRLKSLSPDIYSLPKAENDYDAWSAEAFSKEGKEYATWCSDVEYFMKGIIGGIISSINNKKLRGAVTFNYLVLDPQWMRLAIQGNDKLAEVGENEGGRNTGFRCLYTLVLTIFANKCMWNDFFFNPIFKEYSDFMSGLIREAIQKGPEYKQIMPLTMIKEMNVFKGNQDNARPDLFYDPDWRNMGYTKAEREKEMKDWEEHPVTSIDDME